MPSDPNPTASYWKGCLLPRPDGPAISGADTSKGGDYSRPFDVHRWSDYRELNDCLDLLVTELDGLDQRQRKRSPKDRKSFRDAVRCLVLDLYVAWKTDPALEIGISLSNAQYTRESRYRALFIKWTSFKKAFDGLERSDYLVRTKKGFNDRRTGIGRTTRIKSTKRLIELLTEKAELTIPFVQQRVADVETILLRDAEKRPLEYIDTDETTAMRSALYRINEHLQSHWIDLQITDAELQSLQRRMYWDYRNHDRDRPFIDFGQRSLVRIFNNGDWKQGGRFYHGWWQNVPKEYRRYITIDGKPTSEVDYSGFHAALMYGLVGVKLDGDPYELDQKIDRNLVKTTFNALINASGQIRRPGSFIEEEVGMSWSDLQCLIKDRHKPIRTFFNSGYGLHLQRQDSDLAQAIMLRFLGMGYTCLPVHDSFIVHHALRDELAMIMTEEFAKLTGQSIGVKSKDGTDPSVDPGHDGQPVSMDIAKLLEDLNEYAGYEQRQEEWRSRVISRPGA